MSNIFRTPNINSFKNNVVQASKGLSSPGSQAASAQDNLGSSTISSSPFQQVNSYMAGNRAKSVWSNNMTNMTIAGVQAKKAAEAARVAKAANDKRMADAEAENLRLQGEIDKNPAQPRNRNNPPGYTGGSGVTYNGGPTTNVRETIINTALSKIGTPYAWGGGGYKNPGSRGTGKGTQNVIGVDCSGLTAYAYGSVGIKLPHYSGSQTAMGNRTNIKNARPGDLVGWNRGGHVALYLGNGWIVESPNVGLHVRKRKLRPGEGVYGVRLKLNGD